MSSPIWDDTIDGVDDRVTRFASEICENSDEVLEFYIQIKEMMEEKIRWFSMK